MKFASPRSLEPFSPCRTFPPLKSLRQLSAHILLLTLATLLFTPNLHAQIHQSALSEPEIEQIRACRLVPTDCVLLFVKFLDIRTDEIHDLFAKPRRPGREQDTHDLIEQFTSICDEFADNLDDYGPRHADIRKALPKLLAASERWATVIKSPPEDQAYEVSRKIALESIRDIRESATQLTDEQAVWFKAHPPAKQSENKQNEPIDIPR